MKKKNIVIFISGIVVVLVIGIVTGFVISHKKNKVSYVYTNGKGDKYTQEELLNIKINNSRIGYLESQLKTEAANNLGTITAQGAKDLNASVPTIEEDSAKDILMLQKQLILNLEQDVSSN